MKKWIAVSALAAILLMPVAQASGDHAHNHADKHDHGGHESIGRHESHDMDMSGEGMFLKKKQVGKYTVSFHVMTKKNKSDGSAYELMVKVEEAGHALNNIKVNSKVVKPSGQSATKPLRKMGDWYMADYDLGQPGQYQLMVLFKTVDGEKHKAGVYYNGH